MSLLFRIVYAAHARGTHHKLALDALRHLPGADGELWQRLFLKHAELYMEGAKAPDDQFKDFKNHVLHVGDKFWGGAPEKAESWYRRLVEALLAQNWSEAVYCAGITSHYYTDPIHPFHTGQTEAENNIHRAVEWSISRSYDDLKRIGEASGVTPEFRLTQGADWLRDLVIQGAETSHRSYEALIAHYDINKGVVDPPAGLDDNARRLVGELIIYAARGLAHVLERAFKEAGVAPPEVALTLDTVLAAIKIPVKALLKKLADREDRQQVERMYDELKATGRVEVNLPADDRMVRDLYRAEVLAPRMAGREADRSQRVVAPAGRTRPASAAVALVPPAAKAGSASGGPRADAVRSGGLAEALAAIRPSQAAHMAAPPATPSHAPPPPLVRPPAQAIALEQVVIAPRKLPLAIVPPRAAPPSGAGDVEASAAEPRPKRRTRGAGEKDTAPRPHLAPADDVVAAPSIGPRMADRLVAIGVVTVADLFNADADTLAELLDARGVKGDTIRDWQAQARLVCDVPGLRGTHAQLLVGAGFRDLFAVADCDPATLQVAVLRFAQSKDGERVLRAGEPPDLEKITAWVQSATHVRDARAA